MLRISKGLDRCFNYRKYVTRKCLTCGLENNGLEETIDEGSHLQWNFTPEMGTEVTIEDLIRYNMKSADNVEKDCMICGKNTDHEETWTFKSNDDVSTDGSLLMVLLNRNYQTYEMHEDPKKSGTMVANPDTYVAHTCKVGVKGFNPNEIRIGEHRYRMKCAVVHEGSQNAGHYYTWSRSDDGKQWWKHDDAREAKRYDTNKLPLKLTYSGEYAKTVRYMILEMIK